MGRKIKITVDVTERGRNGGLQRAANMSEAQRKASAKKAAAARWKKAKAS